jgi:hypothetical protein
MALKVVDRLFDRRAGFGHRCLRLLIVGDFDSDLGHEATPVRGNLEYGKSA